MCLRLMGSANGQPPRAVAGYENGGLYFWDLRSSTIILQTPSLSNEPGLLCRMAFLSIRQIIIS